MIVSASRRTDIPAYYFDWFLARLEAGFVLARNPFNHGQVSRIDLSPGLVDCVVFWTKNPAPMLERLERLGDIPFYVQFTVNPYGQDMEQSLPPPGQRLDTFRKLADQIGPERVVWRYSPVIVSRRYTAQFHMDAFGKIVRRLDGYTRQCNLGFLDIYKKIEKRMHAAGIFETPGEEKNRLAKQLFDSAGEHGVRVAACGNIDTDAAGVPAAKCVDDGLIARITGKRYNLKKDRGQPAGCHCVGSIDIGAYNTCLNGCAYCYANQSLAAAKNRYARYDVRSPLLCGALLPGDCVTERAVKREGMKKETPLYTQTEMGLENSIRKGMDIGLSGNGFGDIK